MKLTDATKANHTGDFLVIKISKLIIESAVGIQRNPRSPPSGEKKAPDGSGEWIGFRATRQARRLAFESLKVSSQRTRLT